MDLESCFFSLSFGKGKHTNWLKISDQKWNETGIKKNCIYLSRGSRYNQQPIWMIWASRIQYERLFYSNACHLDIKKSKFHHPIQHSSLEGFSSEDITPRFYIFRQEIKCRSTPLEQQKQSGPEEAMFAKEKVSNKVIWATKPATIPERWPEFWRWYHCCKHSTFPQAKKRYMLPKIKFWCRLNTINAMSPIYLVCHRLC